MIRLTLQSGTSIFVSPEAVTATYRCGSFTNPPAHDNFTFVEISGRSYRVTETPEEIVKMLEEPASKAAEPSQPPLSLRLCRACGREHDTKSLTCSYLCYVEYNRLGGVPTR